MNQENPNYDEINWNHACYMLEKMSELVFELVNGEGNAKWRLRHAVPKLSKIVPGMLPEIDNIRERVEAAFKLLKKYYDEEEYKKRPKNSPESIYDSTIDRIRNQTGAIIINDLFFAWLALRDLYHYHMKS